MGLDMYLNRKQYIGAHYRHNNILGKVELSDGKGPIPVDVANISEIIYRAHYWRKSNQIHGWFVANAQGGEDDCREYDVTSEQLTELRDLCRQVLETKDTGLLPPAEGFFFGGTEIDEYYFEDLRETEQALTKTLNEHPNAEYSYQSSW